MIRFSTLKFRSPFFSVVVELFCFQIHCYSNIHRSYTTQIIVGLLVFVICRPFLLRSHVCLPKIDHVLLSGFFLGVVFFESGEIYCCANFCSYANFSMAPGQSFKTWTTYPLACFLHVNCWDP